MAHHGFANSRSLHFTIAVVPLERWDAELFAIHSPNALDARFGSFIGGAQLFDAAAFGISYAEALYMDPQQRLLLESAGELLTTIHSSPAVQVGVMLGIGPTEYLHLAKQSLPMGLYSATGVAISVAAGRSVCTACFPPDS